jgi:hypothetical protein
LTAIAKIPFAGFEALADVDVAAVLCRIKCRKVGAKVWQVDNLFQDVQGLLYPREQCNLQAQIETKNNESTEFQTG